MFLFSDTQWSTPSIQLWLQLCKEDGWYSEQVILILKWVFLNALQCQCLMCEHCLFLEGITLNTVACSHQWYHVMFLDLMITFLWSRVMSSLPWYGEWMILLKRVPIFPIVMYLKCWTLDHFHWHCVRIFDKPFVLFNF